MSGVCSNANAPPRRHCGLSGRFKDSNFSINNLRSLRLEMQICIIYILPQYAPLGQPLSVWAWQNAVMNNERVKKSSRGNGGPAENHTPTNVLCYRNETLSMANKCSLACDIVRVTRGVSHNGPDQVPRKANEDQAGHWTIGHTTSADAHSRLGNDFACSSASLSQPSQSSICV